MKHTIYDVAREANVSIATVSKVLNNTGRISDKTKGKVLEVVEMLSYQPTMLAPALTEKNTYTIGLLIPDLANPFFAEIARYIEDRGHELGFSVMICSTDHNSMKEEKYISLLKQKRVDGFLLAAGFQNEIILKDLIEEDIPVVLVSQEIRSLPVDCVRIDDFLAGYQVTQYLISLGHCRIGLIAEESRSSSERIRGYKQALEDHGITIDPDLILMSGYTIDRGILHAGQLLDQIEPPSAIFTCNDLFAVGTTQAARERNLEIPEDLSIIGFDNTILSVNANPSLTSVAQPIRCAVER